MQYRRIGKIPKDISALGFGCMRLPTKDKAIDEAQTTAMMDYAVANGVNYFDTAYGYHNKESEKFLGNYIQKHPRESLYLATKLPPWNVKTREDMDRILDDQLEKLQTDYIDFYLLHALNKKEWPKMKELGYDNFLNQAKAKGKIRHIGFSFHD